MALQIYQNGSVALALPPCPVIHSKGSDISCRWAHILLYHPQDRVGAGGNTELRSKAESGFATQSVTDLLQCTTMAVDGQEAVVPAPGNQRGPGGGPGYGGARPCCAGCRPG